MMVVAAALSACQPVPHEQVATPDVAPSRADIRANTRVSADVYHLDSAASWIRLRVYRDGPLARLGHNHVIVAEQITGTILRAASVTDSAVELSFPTAALAIDRDADRAQAGVDFASAVTPEAIAGTRANMLGPKQLAQQQYPTISLRSIAISGALPDLQIVAALKLREFDSQFVLPVHLSEASGMLIAEGEVQLSQTQLGLTPFSVLGGGLRVSDTIDASYRLVARLAKKGQ